MLGVPTRSDAMAISAEYADAVVAEELDEKLRRFRDVLGGVFPHNHVTEAYRDTGNIERFMSVRNIWDIKPRRLPRGVVALLKPELVRDHYLDAVRAFRVTLEETRAMLDHKTETVVQTYEHKPYNGLYPLVSYAECVADYVYEGNAIVLREGQGRGWEYSFNPYQLVTMILEEFERTILSMYDLEPSKIEKIMAMMKVAKDFQDGSNYRLAEGAMSRYGTGSPFSIERREGHGVHKLYLQNERISKKSDLALRFDEMYFISKTERSEMMIPASGLVEPEERMMYFMLSHRVMLRSIFDRVLVGKGRAVLNGVGYVKATLYVGGQAVNGFVTDGQSYQELVNLLGRPVQQPDGVVVQPEAWAAEEVQLVEAFSTSRDTAATEMLLERYELDTSSGNPSREKALGQLEYSLRTERF